MAAVYPARVSPRRRRGAPAALAVALLAVLLGALLVGALEAPALRGAGGGGVTPPPAAARSLQVTTCVPPYTVQSVGFDLPNLDVRCQDEYGCAQGICANSFCGQVEAPGCPCTVNQVNAVCFNGSTAFASRIGGQCVKDADCRSPDGKTWGQCCQGSDKNAMTNCPFPGICMGTQVNKPCAGPVNSTGGSMCGLNNYCNTALGVCKEIVALGAACTEGPSDYYLAQFYSASDPWLPFHSTFELPDGTSTQAANIGQCGMFAGCLAGKCTALFSQAADTFINIPPTASAGSADTVAKTTAAYQNYCQLGLVLDPTKGTCVTRVVTNGNCAIGSKEGQMGLCPSLQVCTCTDPGGLGATTGCAYGSNPSIPFRYFGTRGAPPYAVKQVPKITAAVGALYQCAQVNCNGLQPRSMGLQLCLIANCSSQYAGIPCSLYAKTPDAALIAPLGICCRALVFELDWASVSATAMVPFGNPPPCCGGYCPQPVLNCPVSLTVYVLFGVGCAFLVGCTWFWCYCCWCRRKDWYKDNCQIDKVLRCRCCGCCCASCMDEKQRKKMTMAALALEEKEEEKARARAAAKGENYYKKNPLQAGTGGGSKRNVNAGGGAAAAPGAAAPAATPVAGETEMVAPAKKKKKKKKKAEGGAADSAADAAEEGPLVEGAPAATS